MVESRALVGVSRPKGRNGIRGRAGEKAASSIRDISSTEKWHLLSRSGKNENDYLVESILKEKLIPF
jgi:hypothetical protein